MAEPNLVVAGTDQYEGNYFIQGDISLHDPAMEKQL